MKKFIVNSQMLLTALQYVSKVISKNPVVPILENFLFQVSNGVLTVSGTDLQNTFKLSFRVEVMPSEKFSACVPSTIIKYLQKLDGPITFCWTEEGYSIELLDPDGRAKYSGENACDFPLAPQTNSELFEFNSDLFKELKDLLNYTSNDELRPAMTGIGFISRLGKFMMAATDGHRLKVVEVPELNIAHEMNDQTFVEYVASMEKRILDQRRKNLPIADKLANTLQAQLDGVINNSSKQHFILRSKAAKILSDLKFGTAKKPESTTITVCAGYVEKENSKELANISFLFHLNGFDMELITRVIDERYPQYWNVIPQTSTTQYTAEKKTFLNILNKAELFANKTTHQVRICLNGHNKLTAEDLDFANEYSGDIGGTHQGEPIEIGFNAELLRETINSFGDNFTLEMIAPNKPAVIREGNSLALVMPVMLNQYA